MEQKSIINCQKNMKNDTRIHHLHLIILFIAKTEDEAPALSDSI